MQFLDGDDHATGLYNTGIAYLASGDDEGALSAFDEASRRRPLFSLARERAQQIRTRLHSLARNNPKQVDRSIEK